jgi:hypothetical protein
VGRDPTANAWPGGLRASVKNGHVVPERRWGLANESRPHNNKPRGDFAAAQQAGGAFRGITGFLYPTMARSPAGHADIF